MTTAYGPAASGCPVSARSRSLGVRIATRQAAPGVSFEDLVDGLDQLGVGRSKEVGREALSGLAERLRAESPQATDGTVQAREEHIEFGLNAGVQSAGLDGPMVGSVRLSCRMEALGRIRNCSASRESERKSPIDFRMRLEYRAYINSF